MHRIKPTPRTIVIAYYGGAAALWTGMAMALGPAQFAVSSFGGAVARSLPLEFAALALHAMAVVLLAWKLPRWFFGHGGFAVIFCALPIVFLLPAFGIVPALLYAIGVAYVWEASRRERPGQLQGSPRS